MKRLICLATMVAMMTLATGCAGRQARSYTPRMKPAPIPPLPQQVAIDQSLQTRAAREIELAAQSGEPALRAQAMEAIALGLGERGSDRVIAAIDDPSARVRFAACLAAGQLELRSAHAALLKRADDANPHVRVAALYGLHRVGDRRRSQEIVGYTQHIDERVRAGAAMVLGLLGEGSAVKVLRPMQSDVSPQVRLQTAESLWRLGQEDAFETLAQFAESAFVDDQMFAILAMAGPKQPSAYGQIEAKLSTEYVEINLVAARAIGILGWDRGYIVAQQAAESRDLRQRIMAAMALGAIGRSDSQTTLGKLLNDPSPMVRLAAATGLLQVGAAPDRVAGR